MVDVSSCELVERKVRMKDVVYKKKTRNRNEGCFCMAESWMWEEIIQRENFFKPEEIRNYVIMWLESHEKRGLGRLRGRRPPLDRNGLQLVRYTTALDCPTFDSGYLIKNLSRMCKYPIRDWDELYIYGIDLILLRKRSITRLMAHSVRDTGNT
jgi:hypothetical protein